MNIVAVSYTNLGPFADRTISMIVHPGAAMIIAPVGTGKSMLFFDGIVYGLYKYSTRDIINTACTTAQISILIEVDGEYWLIRRDLRCTKNRNTSTTSTLARWTGDVSEIYTQYPEILYADRDIVSELHAASSEIITFKNESDLQRNLEEFLPARDVFLNRDMMMQESSNLFDLTQTQRIDVFKHLFGLMDIDAAKDKLGEEKTRLKYLLQAKQDTGSITSKFSQTISRMQSAWQSLATSEMIDMDQYDGGIIQSWLDESSILGTTISIEQVPQIQWDRYHDIRKDWEHYKSLYHQLEAKSKQLADTIAATQTQHRQLISSQSRLTAEQSQLQATLKSHNPEQLQALKSEKLAIIQHINDLEFGIDYDVFDGDIADLSQAHEYVQGLTQQGKELQLKMTNITNQIQSGRERQQLQQNHERTQREQLQTQLDHLQAQIHQKQEKIEISSKFYCVKIEADCPFVDQIAQGVITNHARELTALQDQHTSLLASMSKLDTHQSPHDLTHQIAQLEQDKTTFEGTIAELRSTLVKVGYKKIVEMYPQYIALNQQLKQVDQQIVVFDQHAQQIETTKSKLDTLGQELIRIELEATNIQQTLHNYQFEYDAIQLEYRQTQVMYQAIAQLEGYVQHLTDAIIRINELILDYKASQAEIIRIQSRAKQIDELYAIVSKELTVLVLQEYLPILSDTINNLLSKVVEYRLEFTINPSGDKLEIMIVDQYGSREVKTLSGGQRAILRLCWILSIALWSGNQFLFLDETINHLDREMISKAAELIEDFVKGNRISLYAITHSEQIQAINIWDYVVEVKKVLHN